MLPVEVLARILQNIDWASAKTCSLVSRTFLSLARAILFQHVTISLEPDRHGVDSETFRTAQILKFLLEDAEVASFILRLSLDEKRSSRADDTTADWQSNADNLIRLVPKMIRLQHLSIQSSFLSDWTWKNDDLRLAVVRLCLVPPLQSLQLSFIHLQRSELLQLTSIPTLTLFCIDITPDLPTPVTPLSSPLPSSSSIHLRDLTITPRHSDNRLFAIMKAAGSHLASLRIYSSPFDDCLLSILDDIDLSRHPSLLSLAICIPLTGDGCVAKMTSIFSLPRTSEAFSSSTIKYIEICCDVDLHSFPPEETLNGWNWAGLDAILSSNTYENLERIEITVKKVIRSRNTWQRQRQYKDLGKMLVELFKSCLPVVTKAVMVVAGPSFEEDG